MIDDYLFWVLLIIIIIYTLKKTRLFTRFNGNIIEGFLGKEKKRENKVDKVKKFNKDFNDLTKDIPCDPELLKVPEDIGHYISKIIEPTTRDYILLTHPELYLNNLKYISNYNPYIDFIPQNMDYDSIIEQLRFNVYTYNDHKYTDLIGIVPEYYLEEKHKHTSKLKENFNKDTLITHEKKKPSIMDQDMFDYVRYIGGVSYTYYYFLIPIGFTVFSINNLHPTIYILYDHHMIGKSKKYIENYKNKIQNDLLAQYKNDNQLNFIIDYIKFTTTKYNKNGKLQKPKLISFLPKYIDDYVKNEQDEIILGNNNMSHNILMHLGFLGFSSTTNSHPYPRHNIMGFDEHEDTLFTMKWNVDKDFPEKEEIAKQKWNQRHSKYNIDAEDIIKDLYDNYGNYKSDDTKNSFNYEKYIQDEHLDKKTYIERKTKQLLSFHKLNNTLIQNVNVFEIHQEPIKCKYSDNRKDKAINDEKLKILHKAGYDTHCAPDNVEKHLPSTNAFFPIKTFLFRNVAITHKFTNEKIVYNLLYLFMKKIQLNNHTNKNKLKLMSLNTNIELHKGADDFYRKYGFITNIKNVDCIYSVGKESCEVRNRYRHAP